MPKWTTPAYCNACLATKDFILDPTQADEKDEAVYVGAKCPDCGRKVFARLSWFLWTTVYKHTKR